MQQGDIGAPIRFELVDGSDPFPLPIGSVVELWIRKPSQALVRRVFEIVDPDVSTVYYETVAGDLDQIGRYRFQARALLLDGSRIGFRPIDEVVGANIFPPLTVAPDPAVASLRAPVAVLS